jgi:hypothetical protein
MGDFGEQHIGAEIAGPGLCLPPFIQPRLQPARIRRDELSIETSSSIAGLSASLRRCHLLEDSRLTHQVNLMKTRSPNPSREAARWFSGAGLSPATEKSKPSATFAALR